MNIKLNGRNVVIQGNALKYADVREMSGYPPAMHPSVTYRNAGLDGRDEGTLIPGATVIVNDATIINCYDTGGA